MNTITIKNQTLSYLGDASMLLCPMTSFLCSHRVPEGVADAIRQWVNGLDSANTCVVCGNLTGEERLVRRLLVERGIPVVLALANAIPDDISTLRLRVIWLLFRLSPMRMSRIRRERHLLLVIY